MKRTHKEGKMTTKMEIDINFDKRTPSFIEMS